MIDFTKQALKDLASIAKDKQGKKDAQRIIEAIKRFDEKGIGDVRPLKGALKGKYRLRVGIFRVIFSRQGDTLLIESIDRRKDAYRK